MRGLPIDVVLPYCHADAHLALRLLKWINELGGCKGHNCIIIAPSPHSDIRDQISKEARLAFDTVKEHQSPTTQSPWPAPLNLKFRSALNFTQSWLRPWLWLEPDCVPMRSGWLDEIDKEYQSTHKKYLGVIVETTPPHKPYLNGVAVYPVGACRELSQFTVGRQAWDVAMSPAILRYAHNSNLFWHFWGQKDLPPTFVQKKNGRSQINAIEFERIPKDVALAHRCKDGTLEDCVRSSISSVNGLPRPWFEHSGDLGDIIYALPTIKALGGGTLFLTPYPERPPFRCREQMYERRANLIIPLLAAQPYIKHVEFRRDLTTVDYNLNEFRHLLAGENFSKHRHDTLTSLPLKWFGLPVELENERWLEVDPVKPDRPVVVARSHRYHGEFDWKRIAEAYKGRMVFVGTQDEHTRFCDEVVEVPWRKTENLLEVAQLIEGSDLFIGNQSAPFAISEGLKHRAILEWHKDSDNCGFKRSNLIYGVDSRTALPRIESSRKTKPVLNWCTLWDAFSGLGKTSIQFVRRMKSINIRVVPVRLPSNEIEPCPTDILTHSKRDGNQSLVYEAMIGLSDTVKHGDLVFTMWESSKVPIKEVGILNKARAVIVPTAWCACNFAASGVNVPIEIVPLGIDPLKYKPLPKRKQQPLTFGAAARFCADGNPRKQIGIVIDCFKEAFETDDNVRLSIKGYDADLWHDDDPRISIFCEYWPEQKLIEWYQGLDCFVNMAAGGGWELHLQEAMACGAVPIAMYHSSSMEFFSPDNGYTVGFDLVTPTWGPYADAGLWAQPKPSTLVSAMRDAYRFPKVLSAKRKLSLDSANRFTWDGSTRILESVLARYI